MTLAPDSWSDVFFFSVMQERQVRLADIRGRSNAADFHGGARSPFTVEIGELEAGLRALDLPVEPAPVQLIRAVAASIDKPPTMRELFDTANELREVGKVSEANFSIDQAIERAPEEVMLYAYSINICMQQGKITDAIVAAEKSLAIYPSIQILHLMHEHLTGAGRYAEAVDYARRRVALDPDDAEAFSLLGHSLCRVGEFDEAAACFERASVLRPDDFGLRVALARSLAAAARDDAAIGAMRTAIRLFPAEGEGYVLLGRMLAQRGQVEAAINAFHDALRLTPDDPEALAGLASLNADHASGIHVAPSTAAAATEDIGRSIKMHYHEYLGLMHRILEPEAYLEIGVDAGDSFALAQGFSIGIDPNLRLEKPVTTGKTAVKLFRCTSDEFFLNYNTQHELAGRHLGLAFIDGLHLFEFALRDFMNVEQYSDGNTLVLFHDTLPYMPEIADRAPVPGDPAWTGDVWKIVEILERYRPELYLRHVNVAPTGLLAVANLSPSNQVLRQNYENIRNEYTDHPLSPERMENLRKPNLLREPEQVLQCSHFSALVGRARIAQATRRAK